MMLFRSLSGVAIGATLTCIAPFLSSASGDASDRESNKGAFGATDGLGPAEIGRPHPALELDSIDGTLVNGARVAGRVLIVDFFAIWCQPCHLALADLTAARQAAGTDAQLVLVDLGEAPGVVRRWAAAADLPADTIVAVDPAGIAARRWGARRLPTTFIVDAVGSVRHINRGWGPGYRNRMLRWLRDVGVRPSSVPAAPPAPPAPPTPPAPPAPPAPLSPRP